MLNQTDELPRKVEEIKPVLKIEEPIPEIKKRTSVFDEDDQEIKPVEKKENILPKKELPSDEIQSAEIKPAEIIPEKINFDNTQIQLLEESILPDIEEQKVNQKEEKQSIQPTVLPDLVEKLTPTSNEEKEINKKLKNYFLKKTLFYLFVVILVIGSGFAGYAFFVKFGPPQLAYVGNIEYKVDRTYNASIKEKFLVISDKANTWTIEVTSTVDFNSLTEFSSKTSESYEEVKAISKKYDGIDTAIIEINDKDKKFYNVAIKKGSNDYVSAKITYKDNKLNEKIIDVFVKIAKTKTIKY